MRPFSITIDNFIGGQSLNKKTGYTGQFYLGESLDFNSRVGLLGQQRAYGVVCDNSTFGGQLLYIRTGAGSNQWIQGQDGIYKGLVPIGYYDCPAVSKVRTVTACQHGGFLVTSNYLYYAQGAQLGRVDYGAGTPTWTDNFGALNNHNVHPILRKYAGLIIVGDRENLSKVSWNPASETEAAATLTSNILDLEPYYKINSLADFIGNYVAIGAPYSIGGNAPAKIFLWDVKTAHSSWDEEIPLPEQTITGMKWAAQRLYVFATNKIYVIEGLTPRLLKVLPKGSASVWDNEILYHNGRIYFALKSGDEATIPSGIYSFTPGIEPLDLSLDYLTTDNITALGPVSTELLYYGKKANSTYSLERQDYFTDEGNSDEADSYKTGYLISFDYYAPPRTNFLVRKINVEMEKDSHIAVHYRVDGASSWTPYGSVTSGVSKTFDKHFTAKSFQIKVTVGNSSGTSSQHWLRSVKILGDLISKPNA